MCEIGPRSDEIEDTFLAARMGKYWRRVGVLAAAMKSVSGWWENYRTIRKNKHTARYDIPAEIDKSAG